MRLFCDRLVCAWGWYLPFPWQGEFVEQAEKAREKAQQGGGVFQEKFQELKQT